MSTLVIPKTHPEPESPEGRLLLDGISWPDYDTFLRILDERPFRVTYDQGWLEIMALSPEHGTPKNLLHDLIVALGEELGVGLTSFGATAYRREELSRGLEADDCYYHRNLPRVRGKKRIDLSIDPPPDLAIEVDVTRSSLDRMAIYAALRVPEVWRWAEGKLTISVLNAKGEYEAADGSPTFPGIPLKELGQFLQMGLTEDETTMLRGFRAWLRGLLSQRPPQ
jgi:Uma2 family endonuclease